MTIENFERGIEHIFEIYREHLPERFKEDLKGFVNLGCVPVRLGKYSGHEAPEETMESKYGFNPKDLLQHINIHQGVVDGRYETSLKKTKEFFELMAPIFSDPGVSGSNDNSISILNAVTYLIDKGLETEEEAAVYLNELIKSEFGTSDLKQGLELEEVVRNSGLLLIIGEPGAGKTTSCYRLTQIEPSELGVENIFYIDASSFRKFLDTEEAVDKVILARLVSESMQKALEGHKEKKDASTVIAQYILEMGNSLVIIDGLNELGGLSDSLVSQLEKIISDKGVGGARGFGNNKYVLTTRKYNDPITKLTQFKRYEILPLTDEDLNIMIQNSNVDETFKKDIYKIDPIFRTNPLFLDIALRVYKKTGKISENWGQLFESFLTDFLYGWENKTLEKSSDIILGEARPALEKLAYQMTKDNLIRIEWDEALNLIEQESGLHGDQLEGMVRFLLGGRIIKRDNNELKFMGQPIQEVLTAFYLKRNLLRSHPVNKIYESIKTGGTIEPQWRGTLFFLNNQLDNKSLIELVSVIEADKELARLADVTIINPKKFSGKVAINVVNYHGNVQSQREAAEIFDYMIKGYGVRLIGIGGLPKGYKADLSWFKAFPGDGIKERVAREFLENGTINAVGYLYGSTDYPLNVYGMEDMDLYTELYKRSMSKSNLDTLPDGKQVSFRERTKIFKDNLLEIMEKDNLKLAAIYYGDGFDNQGTSMLTHLMQFSSEDTKRKVLGINWYDFIKNERFIDAKVDFDFLSTSRSLHYLRKYFADDGAIYIELDPKTKGINLIPWLNSLGLWNKITKEVFEKKIEYYGLKR